MSIYYFKFILFPGAFVGPGMCCSSLIYMLCTCFQHSALLQCVYHEINNKGEKQREIIAYIMAQYIVSGVTFYGQ